MRGILLSVLMLLAINAAGQTVRSVEIHNAVVEQSKKYRNGNKYQKDFLLFTDALRTTHPAFCKQLSDPFSIDSMESVGYKQLKRCKDEQDFKLYLQRQISILHDGHSSINLNLSTPNDLYYMFNLSYTGDGYILRGVDKDFKDALGKKVEKINGVSAEDFIRQFSQYISGDNEVALRGTIMGSQLQNHFSLVKHLPCNRPDSLLALTMSDGSVVKLRPIVPDRSRMEVLKPAGDTSTSVHVRERHNVPFFYKIDDDHGIAYLQFNACEDRYTQNWMMEQRGIKLTEEQQQMLNSIPFFHETLRKMFSEIENRKIKTLVIDVRQNGGGNSLLCTELMSWLYPVVRKGISNPDYMTVSSNIRFSPLYELFYPEYSKQTEDLCRQQNGGAIDYATLYDSRLRPFDTEKANADSNDGIDKSIFHLLNCNEDSIFKGNVIFIQDEHTFSSAAMLVLEASDNHIGQVIGGESCYNTSNYGDILIWQLPNTKVEGTISHKMFLRPDISRLKEKHFAPHKIIIPTMADLLSGNDPCWEWIVRHYKK
ncbi:S41 family peptidase [Prevotella sp. HUN102]|uniref:S41 family peptidase n=1 Tax=Prevotella sp. HUN102 TaxID=1392486 RepID=UPI0009DF0A83|nr:S41 family peptidase [Prevotella sp. HUN102]